MKHKHPHASELSPAELRLIAQLREHPELMERFQGILEVTGQPTEPIQRAEVIEDLLIQEMRRLGHAAMESWASRAEARLAEDFQQKEPSAGVRKKKPSAGGASLGK